MAHYLEFEQIRDAYPAAGPRGDDEVPRGDYCVGGALCQAIVDAGGPAFRGPQAGYVGASTFPTRRLLAQALTWAGVDRRMSAFYARKIVENNDRRGGRGIENAWRWLERALGSRP